MYLCVEGVIGVGKTTLTLMVSKKFGFHSVLEIVEDNPFLANFYNDRERWAFQTQLFFLLSRYSQQEKLLKIVKRENVIVDYTFNKDELFAQMNLSDDQLDLYERVHNILKAKIAKPDLVVYLRASIGTIMDRIAARGRAFERTINEEYISELIEAYDEFFSKYSEKFVVIDADDNDFVRNEKDFNLIISKIKKCGVEFDNWNMR